MTVVTAMISGECTTHASDSFLTVPTGKGNYEVVDSKQTKIVRVPHYSGIIAYWGLAAHPKFGWNTLKWLRQEAVRADRFDDPEDFAQSLKEMLTSELSRMRLLDKPGAGIGLHFTAYEDIEGHRVPELFRLSNFVNTEYNSVYPDGFRCTRETYNQLTNDKAPLPDHRLPKYRLQVHEWLLKQGGMFIYNNGDPMLFNPVADAILTSFIEIRRRRALRNGGQAATYRDLARSAVDMVCKIQERFVQEERLPIAGQPRKFVLRGKRTIGGRRHALAVRPNGEYIPLTGD